MQETEITVQVFDTLGEIKNKLTKQGFSLVEICDMNDYYFSSEKDVKTLPYSQLLKKSFLVREVKGNEYDVKMIYKNKKIDEQGNVIAEEKTSCKVESFEKALKVLQNCGMKPWCNIKQHMQIYMKDKIGFAVQHVADLGTFIEYEEDETMAGMTEQQKIQYMLGNLRALGLKLGDDYSCKKVYMKFKAEQEQELD